MFNAWICSCGMVNNKIGKKRIIIIIINVKNNTALTGPEDLFPAHNSLHKHYKKTI